MRKLTEEDEDIGRLIDIDEFVGMVVEGSLVDIDGYGRLVYDLDDVDEKIEVAPSDIDELYFQDENLTHILWFDL